MIYRKSTVQITEQFKQFNHLSRKYKIHSYLQKVKYVQRQLFTEELISQEKLKKYLM